ncbi:E3 ubiquitin-protein ligase rad18 [Coemansia sp. RSA 2399]|nr:E3 ubiquitin-protein ligase rad18 [Coemansia sp. RSA 2399]
MDRLLDSLELEDPSDWPSSFPQLREIDQLLRCPVCKEYFETAMVTSGCGHTFCSLCVRRCLTQETKCPACRAPLTEGDLRPNRLVDSLMKSFRGGRQILLGRLSSDARTEGESSGVERCSYCKCKSGPKEESTRKRRRMHTRNMTTTKSGPANSDTDEAQVSNDGTAGFADSDIDQGNSSYIKAEDDTRDDDYIESDSDFAPDSKGVSAVHRGHQMSPTHPSSALQPKDTSVKCPSCQKTVPQSHINKHLDRCLNGHSDNAETIVTTTSLTSNRSSLAPTFKLKPAKAQFMLPRPTKLVYSLLSESKLRRTVKELGIPFKGDKSQLQARHVEWVSMYMANADSETPASHKLLLKRLATWEGSMSRQSDNPRNNQQQHSSLSSQPSDASAIDHATKYAESFAQLIAQANASRAVKPNDLTSK